VRHRLTTTLTLLLVARQSNISNFEHEIEDVLFKLVDIARWSDEQKADLYSLIAESVTATDKLTEIDRKVARCLAINQSRYLCG
jgi:NTP pyrophosphatase (non-canonical NTP hydrolase)